MATPLGEKIKTLRKERGMTLDTLSELAAMSKSYLWELENRDSPRPSAEKLVGLARALSMDISYFLDDEAATPQPQHLDREFFRHYEQLTPEAKAQMRLIIETFKKS